MKVLASRKKLLIAESELNRAQLIREWRMMTDEVQALKRQAGTIACFASAAASLLGGLISVRRKKPANTDEKPSWWKTIVKSAGLAATFWQTLRSPDREPKDK